MKTNGRPRLDANDKTVTRNFRVPFALWVEFKELCSALDKDASTVLRYLIRRYLAELKGQSDK